MPVERIVRGVMYQRNTIRAALRVLLGASIIFMFYGLAGCGPSRTAAATQSTAPPFDPATQDAKALATVDEMVAALGGAPAWAAVKQIRWELKYYQNNELAGWVKHAWDIWNGRHRYEFALPDGIATYKATGQQQPPLFTIAMYDLFDHQGKGYVTTTALEGTPGARGAMAAERDRLVAESFKAWKRDAYQLAMLFKLKDPGVKLAYTGEREPIAGKWCMAGCIDITVTFAEGIGTDLYHLYLNKDTKLPEVIEKVLADNRSVSLAITAWTEAGGLKFPGTLQNIGPAEEYRIENVQITEPDDDLFIPRVFE